MALNSEWQDRLASWTKELTQHFYRKLGVVELEGFVTTEQLTPEEATQREFQPMPAGTHWGKKYDYAWFRGNLTTPPKAAGQRFVLWQGLGHCGGLVFVNGRAAGHLNGQPEEPFLLRLDAKEGESFDLLIEAYAGNHPNPCHAGPTPPDRETVFENDPRNSREIFETSFGLWQQEAYQLWVDVETLRHVMEHQPEGTLRATEIEQALKDFTLHADFELPREEMLKTLVAARERLAPLLAKKNGPTAGTLHAVGHGHLDVAWLWPLAETERKIARTLSNQLALAEEFPFHRFLQSQPHEFWMLQQRYPELYERVRQAVTDGTIIADGAAWVEPDTNISGGEALIRQFLHGKRFFREEFGIESELLWLPDVFGYSGQMPQIMRGCGVKYFATAKIYWTYHGGDQFPHSVFTWEGIDGSEVLTELIENYSNLTTPEKLISNWRTRRTQDAAVDSRLFAFGWGDGGGGPGLQHLEFAKRAFDLEGCPKLKLVSPVESFRKLEQAGPPKARYVGELYFQAHRGVYTSQAKTKLGNRRSEFALREAELWSVAAAGQGFAFPTEEMTTAWRKVLLNQFHDILPGSSISRVYAEAEADYAEVIAKANEVTDAATGKLVEAGEAVTVFNSLSWERPVQVALPDGWAGAIDHEDDSLCVQDAAGRKTVETIVPSCGWTTLRRADEPRSCAGAKTGGVQAEVNRLENDLVRVEFDAAGEIAAIFDKQNNQPFAAGPCNRFEMFKDVPTQFDAWDIDSMYEQQPVELEAEAAVEVVAQGPLFATLRITKRLHNSDMTQEVTLRRGSRRVDFHTVIDWQERHKLLKVAFETNLHANEAIHEIQFGHIARPNHRSRPFDADRFEVANQKWTALCEARRGLAVLNDCKYGVNVLGRTIRLTLLKSALAPDMQADLGRQEFTYAVSVWDGNFADSGVVREGYDLNVPATITTGQGGRESLLALDADNIIIEAVKPAEDGSGDTIVRLYESMRTATRCTLTATLPVSHAVQADMLESETAPLALTDGKVALDFRPFEIKTVRLKG